MLVRYDIYIKTGQGEVQVLDILIQGTLTP